MNWNSNSRKLTLTKTELATLAKAHCYLIDLERIGHKDLSDAAAQAAESLGMVRRMLAGEPDIELNPAGEMPY